MADSRRTDTSEAASCPAYQGVIADGTMPMEEMRCRECGVALPDHAGITWVATDIDYPAALDRALTALRVCHFLAEEANLTYANGAIDAIAAQAALANIENVAEDTLARLDPPD